MTAKNPKPEPPSTTAKKRPRAFAGARSPKPIVKNVVPLKYSEADSALAVPLEFCKGVPNDQCSRAKPRINPPTHVLKSPNNERGPKTLRKVSRRLGERKA